MMEVLKASKQVPMVRFYGFWERTERDTTYDVLIELEDQFD